MPAVPKPKAIGNKATPPITPPEIAAAIPIFFKKEEYSIEFIDIYILFLFLN